MNDIYCSGFGLQPCGIEERLSKTKHIFPDPEHVYNTGDGNVLVYLPYGDIWFYSSPYSVAIAENMLNRMFICDGCGAAIGDFYRFLHLPDHLQKRDDIGWEPYVGDTEYGHMWVDFFHYSGMTESGVPVFVAEYATPPYPDYRDDNQQATLEARDAYRRWEEQK